MKRSYTAIAGDAFILISVVSFFFIWYPLIQAFVAPSKLANVSELLKKPGSYIDIPKIHAQSIIVPDIDPWNETEYKEALKHGVAHARGTALPGANGTSFIFAHSSGAPWEITHTNTLFLRLGELQKNDEVIIISGGTVKNYIVYDKKEVWPNETNYFPKQKAGEKDSQSKIILQTCTPIGTSLKRLLVFAKLTGKNK